MASLLSSVGIATALILGVWWIRHFRNPLSSSNPPVTAANDSPPPVPHPLSQKLEAALPQRVLLLHRDGEQFRESINAYFSGQARDVVQAAIVQPRTADEVATAVHIIKEEYDHRQQQQQQQSRSCSETEDVLFAVRGGGQSPVASSASAHGGVLIDLTHLREVTVAEDRESVTIGAGCRWIDVLDVLDPMGLGVVGGRSNVVGVAGFTLGGGISFYTPQYGLACSNVFSYDVVLASGEIVTATATSHPDLWRALKGGANNFGIVTRFTMRCFPCTPLWAGFIWAPGFEITKALRALHDSVQRVDPHRNAGQVDLFAAGAITCYTYVQSLRLRVIAQHLTYTKPPEQPKKWPVFWQQSGFSRLWRFGSTPCVRTASSAIKEMLHTGFIGQRNSFGTTTIHNDLATMLAVREVFDEAMGAMRRMKGVYFNLVMQPLLPSWTAKGDPNMLGIHESTDTPLIIVSLSFTWASSQDDAYVGSVTRGIIEKIDAVANAKGTGHPYRFLNYCEKWQRPLEGYGEENLRLLRRVAGEYDPDGLFQRGCIGGFKLHPEATSTDGKALA
ncbi:FAD binding domain protein [Aspergillus heteromorphus CBS 117.55]|uniref:FAD binding domain protein n=1 Tax=Aspergillus heteromorphus CBS 117.55 TaxID=1448321 RepID=A0A317WEE7_9EURO|nr:FAD binding domain protein [Aspergillus heteromorphus CBS 117.55]PWY83398.1 FAD binding domain protein [Aspergillus heteromorphus CBS 117.55]